MGLQWFVKNYSVLVPELKVRFPNSQSSGSAPSQSTRKRRYCRGNVVLWNYERSYNYRSFHQGKNKKLLKIWILTNLKHSKGLTSKRSGFAKLFWFQIVYLPNTHDLSNSDPEFQGVKGGSTQSLADPKISSSSGNWHLWLIINSYNPEVFTCLTPVGCSQCYFQGLKSIPGVPFISNLPILFFKC